MKNKNESIYKSRKSKMNNTPIRKLRKWEKYCLGLNQFQMLKINEETILFFLLETMFFSPRSVQLKWCEPINYRNRRDPQA